MAGLSYDELCFLLSVAECVASEPDFQHITDDLAYKLVASDTLRRRWYLSEFGLRLKDPLMHTNRLPLIGRSALVEEIVDTLRTTDRHLCLTGSGGVGKSRIAREVARLVSPMIAYRWLIKATELTTVDSLKASVIMAVGLPNWDELLARMQLEPALLILDDLNPTDAILEEIARISLALPLLRFLITTRRPVTSALLKSWRVGPLSYSSRKDLVMAATPIGAPALFARRLSGLPLALILGASMASAHIGPQSVYATQGPLVATTNLRSIVGSMRSEALIDLAYLATFAGQFSREDAASLLHLSGRSSENIDALSRSSYLTTEVPEYFSIHDEVRAQVLAQLGDDRSKLWNHANECHAKLFRDRAKEIGALFRGGDWPGAINSLESCRVDCEKSAEWARQQHDDRLGSEIAHGICYALFETGFLTSFDKISTFGLEAARQLQDTEIELHLMGLRGAYLGRLGRNDAARELWVARHEMAKERQNWKVFADSFGDLALQDWSNGDYLAANQKLDEMEGFLNSDRGRHLTEYRAGAHVVRSFVLDSQGQEEGSKQELSKAIDLLPQCRDRNMIDFLAVCIGRQLTKWRDYETAETYVRAHLAESASGHLVIACSIGLIDLAKIYEKQNRIIAAAPLLVGAVQVLNEFQSHHLIDARSALHGYELRHGAVVADAIASAYERTWQSIISEALGTPTQDQQV